MTDKKIIGLSIACAIVLLAVGAFVAVRLATPKSEVANAAQPVAPSNKTNQPSTRAAVPAPVPPREPTEVERLRRENQLLKQQAQQREQLLIQKSQRLAELERQLQKRIEQEQSAAAKVAANSPPTADEVEALGKELASLIEKRFWKNTEESSKLTDSALDARTKIEIKVALENFDVVRTDSLTTPVVGEVVLRSFHSTNTPGVYTSYSVDKYTIRVAKADGRWKMVSGSSRCDTHSSFPQTEYFKDRTGETKTLSPDWLKEELNQINAERKP